MLAAGRITIKRKVCFWVVTVLNPSDERRASTHWAPVVIEVQNDSTIVKVRSSIQTQPTAKLSRELLALHFFSAVSTGKYLPTACIYRGTNYVIRFPSRNNRTTREDIKLKELSSQIVTIRSLIRRLILRALEYSSNNWNERSTICYRGRKGVEKKFSRRQSPFIWQFLRPDKYQSSKLFQR